MRIPNTLFERHLKERVTIKRQPMDDGYESRENEVVVLSDIEAIFLKPSPEDLIMSTGQPLSAPDWEVHVDGSYKGTIRKEDIIYRHDNRLDPEDPDSDNPDGEYPKSFITNGQPQSGVLVLEATETRM